MAATTTTPRPRNTGKGGNRRDENNKIYANPLPLLLSEPPPSTFRSLLGLLGISRTDIFNPHCEGHFDALTRSVWVTNREQAMLLWHRGFFGKGDLSRSEPSWLTRQINNRKAGGKQMTSEEITAKRRAERKQFKLDRAKAIAAVAAEAEAIFATEGRVIRPALSGPAIPSAATWRPAPRPADVSGVVEGSTEDTVEVEEQEEEEEELEDVEHLQLTLQEAFFLLWNLDCLTVLTSSQGPLALKQIWLEFQWAHLQPPIPSLPKPKLRPDNPFLIHYVAYHHFRSLGWVVKGGIKFCVDYLLYRRGPVFSHAEFAVVICPTYEDPNDSVGSSYENDSTSPFSWSWMSTLNRVNSQVQKTLVLAYVTIPARSRLSDQSLQSPACLHQYTVREVVIRRFVPARMRD